MLGLSNAITSGSHHEQQYSLDLDGNSDYLDIGDNWDPHQNDFSVSLWFKADSDSGALNLLFSKLEDNNNKIEIGINGDNKLFAQAVASSNNAINNTAGTELDALGLNWIHVVLTMDRDGNGKLYVNGSTSTYGLTASCQNEDQNLNNTGSIYIGARSTSTPSEYFPGKIDEVAIFNGSLSETSVATIYNSGKPFDLNYDRGNYTNSSNLHGYWRMFNGPFDDKQDGIIHDAHNPGFASQLVSTPYVLGSSSGEWAAYNHPSGTTGIATDGSILTVTLSGGGNNVQSGARMEVSSLITAGKVYKIQADVWLGTATTTAGFSFHIGSQVQNISPISSTQTTYTVYLTATSTADLLIYQTDVDSETGTYFITNVSVQELNGYPGLTSGTATFATATPDD